MSPYDAITNPNLDNWVFYWHFESPTCTNAIPTYHTTSGAIAVANNSSSDFALLNLTEDPADDCNITSYYLGWDRSGSPGTGGVGIHHPSGDVKKIATHNITPSNSNCFNLIGKDEKFWKLKWKSTTNGYSVTEGGSSGSPLINNAHKVIGQLYGAGPFCSNPDCSNPSNDVANYGKFNVSWTGDGASDNRRRLDHWLHPGSGSAPTTLNGNTGKYIAGPPIICTSGTYTIENVPLGSTISWSASPPGQVTLSPSGTACTVTKIGSAAGTVILYVSVNQCGKSYILSKQIEIGPPSYSWYASPTENIAKANDDGELEINMQCYGSFGHDVYWIAPFTKYTNISWTKISSTPTNTSALWSAGYADKRKIGVLLRGPSSRLVLKADASNSCGTITKYFTFYPNGINCATMMGMMQEVDYYDAYMSHQTLIIIYKDEEENKSELMKIIISDKMGNIIIEKTDASIKENKIQIDMSPYKSDNYYVVLQYADGNIEPQQVAKF